MDDYCPNRERIGIQALSFRGELLNFRGVFFLGGEGKLQDDEELHGEIFQHQ